MLKLSLKNKDIKNFIPLILCTVLMIIFIIIANGYAADREAEAKAAYLKSKTELEAQEETSSINYLRQNPITVETVASENSSGNPAEVSTYNKIVVSGLADSTIQDKINQTITDSFNELIEETIPEYRGMDAVVDFSSKKKYESVNATVTGNFNDILSIIITKKVIQGGYRYSDCRTLNINLHTGDSVGIKDLFPEGCEFINNYIANNIDLIGNKYKGGKIYDNSKAYLMISAFKGVRDNQKFYLSDNKLNLVIDYTNPEFYQTEYNPIEISVGYDVLAGNIELDKFCKGFGNSENDVSSTSDTTTTTITNTGSEAAAGIYSDGTVKYMLVSGSGTVESIAAYEPTGSNNIEFNVSCCYPEDMPQFIKNMAANLCTVDNNTENELKKEANKNPKAMFRYNCNVRGSKIGGYYNLRKSVTCFRNNHQNEDDISYVFDSKGNQVYLKDIFKDGFDYGAVLKECIAEKLKYDFSEENYGGKSIYDILNGVSFELETYGIQIKTQPINFTSASGTSDYESSVSVFIPYEKFGCDYMTIFN